jgi:hypothetical protein
LPRYFQSFSERIEPQGRLAHLETTLGGQAGTLTTYRGQEPFTFSERVTLTSSGKGLEIEGKYKRAMAWQQVSAPCVPVDKM